MVVSSSSAYIPIYSHSLFACAPSLPQQRRRRAAQLWHANRAVCIAWRLAWHSTLESFTRPWPSSLLFPSSPSSSYGQNALPPTDTIPAEQNMYPAVQMLRLAIRWVLGCVNSRLPTGGSQPTAHTLAPISTTATVVKGCLWAQV